MAYMQYVTEWGKSYGTKAEFSFRFEQYKNTQKKMDDHNADKRHGSTVAHNQFSDWTEAEFKKMLGYKYVERTEEPELLSTNLLADEVDWRTKGAVTPVKNQGQCGSCWAFSTTGSVEGAMFQSSGTLKSYSEQQLVDCSTQNEGCNGGLMDYAFKYIETAPLMLEAEYPYKAKKGSCEYVASKGEGKVKAFKDVAKDSTGDQLKAAVAKGPVSVAIQANQMSFQGYHSGIIEHGCGEQLDHGVLAVGYGSAAGPFGRDFTYFIVKNSWGPTWGDKGYVKISHSQCGITMQPSYPTE